MHGKSEEQIEKTGSDSDSDNTGQFFGGQFVDGDFIGATPASMVTFPKAKLEQVVQLCAQNFAAKSRKQPTPAQVNRLRQEITARYAAMGIKFA